MPGKGGAYLREHHVTRRSADSSGRGSGMIFPWIEGGKQAVQWASLRAGTCMRHVRLSTLRKPVRNDMANWTRSGRNRTMAVVRTSESLVGLVLGEAGLATNYLGHAGDLPHRR
jgi:hypothetical protein